MESASEIDIHERYYSYVPETEVEAERQGQQFSKLSPWLDTSLSLSIFALLFYLPIAFGGVHYHSYLPAQLICYLLLAICTLRCPAAIKLSHQAGSLGRILATGLALVICYQLAQSAIFYYFSPQHPVLGQKHTLIDPLATWSSINQLFFFLSALLLLRVWLGNSDERASKLLAALVFCGVLVSFIALAHWFYDNGKLFWTFAPENVFTSPRARWPFVNANHLGYFLLPVFFLLSTKLLLSIHSVGRLVKEKIEDALFDRRKGYRSILAGSRLQVRVLRAVVFSVALIAVGLAISGSLSRGAWFSWSLGIIGMLLMERRLRSKFSLNTATPRSMSGYNIEDDSIVHTNGNRKRRRRSGQSESKQAQAAAFLHQARYFVRPIVFCFALGVFYIFLAGGGGELLEERLSYGLMYSKDDIRWQFYADTLNMLKDNILFGVGAGAWLSSFRAYQSYELAGLNPEYLHSDPLQFLAEGGLVGGFLMLLLLLLAYRRISISIAAQPDYKSALLIFGLALGASALLLGSCFDFPLRLPGITFFLAAFLALIAFYTDKPINQYHS